MGRLHALWALVCVALLAVPAAAQEFAEGGMSVADTLQASRESGKPILALIGSRTCGPCMALKERLKTERALQPILAQFVPLILESGSVESAEWRRQFTDNSMFIPIMHVVRADGQQLFGDVAPQGDQLQPFLIQHLKQSGTPMPAAQLEQMKRALALAQEAEQAGNVPGAIDQLARFSGSGSFAEPAVQLEEMVTRLSEQARSDVREAEKKARSSDEQQAIEGAVLLTELARTYGRLPELGKELSLTLADLKRDRATREVMSQAALIDAGKQAQEKSQARQAAEKYQTVIARYPGTPAAALAQSRISELEASVGQAVVSTVAMATSTEAQPAAPDASSPTDEKKAASYLRMARVFAASNKAKAREYLQKLLDEQPESTLVGEARTLMQQLNEEVERVKE